MPIILDGTTGITTPGITNTGTFVFQGPVQVPAGSAATASITTAAGANTGIFFPSSSSVAITTAGTEKVSVGTGLIINDGGADFDTRIEGDTDANLFFVDASTDRVGVGTNAPGTKFDVAGIIRTVGTGYSAANSPTLYLDNTTASTGRRYALNSANNGIFQIADDTAGGATRLIIDASGNLGLGVTPSAWSGLTALQVSNAMSLWSANNDLAYYSRNVYYDGSNRKYVFTGAAAEYTQGAGTHAWFTAPSGTAGNTITFTQAMTLDASGRLGIGTTSPDQKLVVDGGASSTYMKVVGQSSDGYFGQDSAGLAVYQAANKALYFATNNTERARIDTSGNLLIGTTSHTSGGIQKLIAINDASTCGITFNRSGAVTAYIYTYNLVGFRVETTGSYNEIQMVSGGSGGVYMTTGATSWTAISDERSKDIIEPITGAAEKVSSLRAVIGKYKSDADGTRRSFLIAQDVDKVLPEAVNKSKNEEWGLSYTDTIPLLVAAIKELKAELDALKGSN
jgi:hypothetical protein